MMRSPGRLLVIAGTFGTALAQWAIVLVFTNAFGKERTGEYITLYTIATPTFVAAQLGLRDVYLTLADRVRRSSYLRLRGTGTLLGVLVLVSVALALGLPAGLTAAMALMKVGESMLDLRYAFIQSQHRMVRLGVLMLAYAGGLTLLVVVFTALGYDPAVAVAATGCFGVILASVDMLRPLEDPAEITGQHGPILRAAVPVTAAQLVLALVSSAPVLLIIAFGGGNSQVAAYGAAAYLLVFANLVGASVQTLLMPRLRDLEAAGRRDELLAVSGRAAVVLSGLAGLGAVIAITFGPQVLGAVYGPDFALDRTTLTPLVLAAAIIAPAYLLNALLLVLNAYNAGTIAAVATLVGLGLAGVAAQTLTHSPLLAASVAALGGSLTRVAVSSAMVRSRLQRTA